MGRKRKQIRKSKQHGEGTDLVGRERPKKKRQKESSKCGLEEECSEQEKSERIGGGGGAFPPIFQTRNNLGYGSIELVQAGWIPPVGLVMVHNIKSPTPHKSFTLNLGIGTGIPTPEFYFSIK